MSRWPLAADPGRTSEHTHHPPSFPPPESHRSTSNPGIEVLRRDSGGTPVGLWWGTEPGPGFEPKRPILIPRVRRCEPAYWFNTIPIRNRPFPLAGGLGVASAKTVVRTKP